MKLAKLTFAGLLALLLVAAVAFLVGSGESETAAPLVAGGGQDAALSESPAASLSRPDKVGIAIEKSIEPVGGVESRVAIGSAQSSGELVLEGELIVEERLGGERRDANGLLHIRFRMKHGRVDVPVNVTNSHWRIRFVRQPSGVFSLTEGSVEALGRIFDESLERAIIYAIGVELTNDAGELRLVLTSNLSFGTRFHSIYALRTPPFRFLVQDAETGADLTDVTILRVRDRHHNDLHPGDMTRYPIAENATSPIDLQAELHAGAYLVGSPGYAWKNAKLKLEPTSEHRVLLERGGSLEVTLAGVPAPPEAVVRLHRLREPAPTPPRPKQGSKVRRTERGPRPGRAQHDVGESRRFLFEDLAAGRYQARVELGESTSAALVLAEGLATVEAGELAQLTLQVEPRPKLTTARLAGHMILPQEWNLDRFTVNLFFIGMSLSGEHDHYSLSETDFKLVEGSPEMYAFDLGEIQTGKYAIRLDELAYSDTIELNMGGRTDVRFEVPPPVTISVHVRDATTGQAAPTKRLSWHCALPDGFHTPSPEYVERSPDDEDFQLRVPATSIEIDSYTDFYSSASATVQARPGLEVVLDVSPRGKALIQLMDGERPIQWPRQGTPSVHHLDGRQTRISGRYRGMKLLLRKVEPDRYRITLPEFAGFEPHPPIEVDIVAGETTEVVVQLVRSP